jgi:hypothetical protein
MEFVYLSEADKRALVDSLSPEEKVMLWGLWLKEASQ